MYDWIRSEVGEEEYENRRSKMLFRWKLYGSSYSGVYGSADSYINLSLSIHINYKTIGLVLRELWIFEV